MVELLVHLAEKETLFSTPKISELKKGKCWQDGNTKAKCPTHTTEHASHYFVAFVYAAIVLREHMNDEEKALLDTLYIATRRGKRFARLPELNLEAIDASVLSALLDELVTAPAIRRAIRVRLERLGVLPSP